MKIEHTIKLPDNEFEFDVNGVVSYTPKLKVTLYGNVPDDVRINYPDDYISPVKRLTKLSDTLIANVPGATPDIIKDVMSEIDFYGSTITDFESGGKEIVEKYKGRVKKITDAYKLLLTNLLDQMADELDVSGNQLVDKIEEQAISLVKEKIS